MKDRDYEQFQNATPVEAPSQISRLVLDRVRLSLNPPQLLVFRKLLGVHFISAMVTLLFCPQFGVGPLGGGAGLMGFIMKYGYFACAFFCGAIFLGSSAVLSHLVLRREELRVLYRAGLWQFSLLGILSVMIIMIMKLLWMREIDSIDPYYFLVWLTGGAMVAYGLNIAISRVRTIEIGYGHRRE